MPIYTTVYGDTATIHPRVMDPGIMIDCKFEFPPNSLIFDLDTAEQFAADLTARVAAQRNKTEGMEADGVPRLRLIWWGRQWLVELPDGWHARGWYYSHAYYAETGRYAYAYGTRSDDAHDWARSSNFRKDIMKGIH